LLYGDAPMTAWPPTSEHPSQEPWRSFERARDLVATKDVAAAQALWRQIAATPDIESRHVLQAWTFLRDSGELPEDEVAAETLGAVAQVPMKSSHDVLAAYADGSVRYLNHSGKVAVVEPPTPDDLALALAVAEWLSVAGQLARAIGPWTGPLPDVPRGHARVLMLTPSGPRFGQGPYEDLGRDGAASAFLGAAATVLQLVVGMAA
jgi:hypothetical protein